MGHISNLERGTWPPALPEVWDASNQMRRLGELAEAHRGIEFNSPFRDNASILASDSVRSGFLPDVQKVKDAVEPFVVLETVHLNTNPEFMRGSAYNQPWDQPKLIVNARRRTRGAWTISASIDYEGIVCYQNFHGVWSKGAVSLETLAAILNGPVANAFVATREGKRDVQVRTLLGIPCPELTPAQDEAIASLVRQYMNTRKQWLKGSLSREEGHETCETLLRWIDAEVLKAYDLAPRTERILLDCFLSQTRPGPVTFTGYFPTSFQPRIPWHRYLSDEMEKARASSTLGRLPIIDDPIISAALEDLYEELAE